MPSPAKHISPAGLPEQMDAWKHTVITPMIIRRIEYADGRKGIVCTLADHSMLTIVMSERSAASVWAGDFGSQDGPTIKAQDTIPGLEPEGKS